MEWWVNHFLTFDLRDEPWFSDFCVTHDANNENLKIKIHAIDMRLNDGLPTIPSTMKDELECNIFLRSINVEAFSKLRDLKDNF